MIFVLNYDRLLQLALEEFIFTDTEVDLAEQKRVELEATFAGNDNVEVVLLRSESLEMLEQTHSRYTRSTSEIARRIGEKVA